MVRDDQYGYTGAFLCQLAYLKDKRIIEFLKNQAELIREFKNPLPGLLLTYIPAIAIMILPYVLKIFSIEMEPLTAGLVGMLFTILIMILGMQIMFALGLMGFLGLWYVSGNDTALQIVRMCVFDCVADYFFCVIPFFVMMGFLCFRSGMSRETGSPRASCR